MSCISWLEFKLKIGEKSKFEDILEMLGVKQKKTKEKEEKKEMKENDDHGNKEKVKEDVKITPEKGINIK
jgi:hypothetical protein